MEALQVKETVGTFIIFCKVRNSPTETDTVQTRLSAKNKWTLYIIECSDGTFYTGITNDLSRRLLQHNDGSASRYTRVRTPVKLLYQEECAGRSEALIKEAAIKALSRKEKESLINQKVRRTAFNQRKRRPQA